MQIGELSKRCDISNDTLRYYEKHELISPIGRSEGGYRLYGEEAVARIRFIQRAKAVGFTLNGIRELLSLQVEKEHVACGDVKKLTVQKLSEVEQKIHELTEIKQALEKLNKACEGGPESATHCTILEALETGEGLS